MHVTMTSGATSVRDLIGRMNIAAVTAHDVIGRLLLLLKVMMNGMVIGVKMG